VQHVDPRVDFELGQRGKNLEEHLFDELVKVTYFLWYVQQEGDGAEAEICWCDDLPVLIPQAKYRDEKERQTSDAPLAAIPPSILMHDKMFKPTSLRLRTSPDDFSSISPSRASTRPCISPSPGWLTRSVPVKSLKRSWASRHISASVCSIATMLDDVSCLALRRKKKKKGK
jgi:hypothetical protein